MDLQSYIREVPDFPKQGILFYDIAPLLQSPEAFQYVIDQFVQRYREVDLDAIAALDARGFLFGAPLALALKLPFIPLRKEGKLPAECYRHAYDLEYGQNTLEIHRDALSEDDRVVIVDDLLATGGTAAAGIELVQACGASVYEVACVIELDGLNGKEALNGTPLFRLLELKA